MRARRYRYVPGFDLCEVRLALAGATGTGDNGAVVTAPLESAPTINPVLSAYANAYLTHVGQPNYNPAVDVHHTGVIGMGAALPILRSLAPITPRSPLRLLLNLAPGEQANTPHPANSGGVTRAPKNGSVTVIGKTTPNSLVFTDDANNDFKFRGGTAIPVDSAGFFSVVIKFDGVYNIAQHNFMVIDPFGHVLRRAFPILIFPS